MPTTIIWDMKGGPLCVIFLLLDQASYSGKGVLLLISSSQLDMYMYYSDVVAPRFFSGFILYTKEYSDDGDGDTNLQDNKQSIQP